MDISKKRLAIFLAGLYGGGAERIMLNLAKGIAERGYPLDLVLARAEGPYLSDIPESVRLVDLKARRVISSIPALMRYFRQERPFAMLTALHANLPTLLARRLAGLPERLIVSEHNTLSQVTGGTTDLRWQIYPQLAHWMYPWADGVIAVSGGVASDLAKTARLRLDSIQVIYNPIVTPEMQRKSQETIEHPWFKPGEPPVLLAVGRLTAQKAFDILLKAFARVRQARPARLLILGEGEDRQALETLVYQLGLESDVSLPGFVSNPYAYMAQASVFVLSSRWEGLPTVLVEAMAFGTPVVSTDCPSGPHEILQNGKYGQLVPVEDVDALAHAIQVALDGKVSRPPVESWKPFEMDTVVDQYIKILFGD